VAAIGSATGLLRGLHPGVSGFKGGYGGTAQERPRVANERPLNDRPLPIISPPKDGA